MPTRVIREGILSSKKIALLSPEEELFFWHLMMVVDDYGRYEAEPLLLVSRCFPLTFDRVSPTNVSKWLTNVSGKDGLVTLYEVQGKKYLQINNFGQRCRSASKFPEPLCGQLSADVRELQQSAASRARSPSPPTSEEDPWSWFEKTFLAEIETDAYQEFIVQVNSPERWTLMHTNLPLWMKTAKYAGGHGRSARWFLRDGLWMKTPTVELMGKGASANGTETVYREMRDDD